MNTLNKNLRRDTVSGLFLPAKSNRRFSDLSLTPLLELPHGNLLLCHSGQQLHILDISTDTVILSHSTSSAILTATLCNENLAVVFLRSGQLMLEYSAEGWSVTPPVVFPEPRITRADGPAAEATAPERKLSKSYTITDHSLNSADSDALTADLLDAYAGLRRSSDSAGVFIQPVFARCRYLDSCGNTIFLTPPVIVSSENGFQCAGSLSSIINSESGTRGAIKLSAETFSISINIPSEACRQVSKMLIEVTPQLDIVDFGGNATSAVMRNSDGNLTIRTILPMAPHTAIGIRRLASSALDHLESLFSVAAVIANPFDGTSRTLTIGADAAGAADVKSAVAALRKKLTAPISPSTSVLIGNGTVPHSFTCSAVAKNGDTLLMGDITILPFQGYSLPSFACQFADEKWKAAIAVEFSGGTNEKIVRYCEGDTASPVLLGPVISYPRSDASSITVFFQSAGNFYRRIFPLTPSRSGNFAYYVTPELKPIDMKAEPADFFIVPAENRVPHSYSGTIAAAHSQSPSSPYDFRHITRSQVTAITHALGSSAGWDYLRSRFYLFSPEGTFTVITDSSAIRSTNMVDSRGVSDRSNVIPVTRYGVAVLTDSADLLLWRGISPSLAGQNLHGEIAYDSLHDEFWLFGTEYHLSGAASATLPFSSGNAVERTFPDTPLNLCHTPGGTILRGESGLYLLGDEHPDEEPVDVRFLNSFFMKTQVKGVNLKQRRKDIRLRAVKLAMQSPGPANLTLTLHGDRGTGIRSAPEIYRFRIRGAVNAPLLFHTPSPHFYNIYAAAQGSVPSDSSFSGFEFLSADA